MAFRVAAVAFFLCLRFWNTQSKIYDRCELAFELREVYEIPEHQLATWLCIANYESHFNTSAHNRKSGDHGLFQISELFWCSPPGVGQACGLPCSSLKDDDIEDDVICARRIYRQHQRISGDGFTAWVVYNLHCRNKQHVNSFIDGCFDYENAVRYGYLGAAMNLAPTMVPMPESFSSPSSMSKATPGKVSVKPTATTKMPPNSMPHRESSTKSNTDAHSQSTSSGKASAKPTVKATTKMPSKSMPHQESSAKPNMETHSQSAPPRKSSAKPTAKPATKMTSKSVPHQEGSAKSDMEEHSQSTPAGKPSAKPTAKPATKMPPKSVPHQESSAKPNMETHTQSMSSRKPSAKPTAAPSSKMPPKSMSHQEGLANNMETSVQSTPDDSMKVSMSDKQHPMVATTPKVSSSKTSPTPPSSNSVPDEKVKHTMPMHIEATTASNQLMPGKETSMKSVVTVGSDADMSMSELTKSGHGSSASVDEMVSVEPTTSKSRMPMSTSQATTADMSASSMTSGKASTMHVEETPMSLKTSPTAKVTPVTPKSSTVSTTYSTSYMKHMSESIKTSVATSIMPTSQPKVDHSTYNSLNEYTSPAAVRKPSSSVPRIPSTPRIPGPSNRIPSSRSGAKALALISDYISSTTGESNYRPLSNRFEPTFETTPHPPLHRSSTLMTSNTRRANPYSATRYQTSFTKTPESFTSSRYISTTQSSEGQKFPLTSNSPISTSRQTGFKPLTHFSSSSSSTAAKSSPFSINSGFSKSNPVQQPQTKYDTNLFKFRPDENVYAVINDAGYSYAISSRGFKLVFTGQ